MRNALIAIGIGIAAEVFLIVAFVLGGGLNPCGGGGSVSDFVYFIHQPGFLLLSYFSVGESEGAMIWVLPVYVVLWSVIAYRILDWLSKNAC